MGIFNAFNGKKKQKAEHSSGATQVVKPEDRTKPLILIIEDEALLVRMYAQKLKADGFDVLSATNGTEGEAKARETIPDLIVCDIMLPQKDGINVLKDLKEDKATSSIPVIMLSNLSEQKYVDEALEIGAVSYLVKSDLVPADVVKEIKEKLKAAGKESLLSK